MSISETIRQAVHESGWTVDALAERAGVAPDTLHDFLAVDSPFEVADKLSEVPGLEVVEEIDFDEYVDQHWPEYAKVAWAEYERDAWYEAKLSGEWAQDNYNEWYDTEYPEWESKERAEWEQAERDRLESLAWVSIIGGD